ncbi:unnamed protein product [Lathyrus sativus]|nr:unnamed protein product [Lathyrus sativus]
MVDWHALECILEEIGVRKQFITWIMLIVSTVSYRFNVDGCYTENIETRRGIRQGDPLYPFFFVIIMEYLNRSFIKMQKNPNFNHHFQM